MADVLHGTDDVHAAFRDWRMNCRICAASMWLKIDGPVWDLLGVLDIKCIRFQLETRTV